MSMPNRVGAPTRLGHNGGPPLTREELEGWSDEELAYLSWQRKWRKSRRANQVPPPGDWTVWNILAGRGFGKTRTAGETLAWWAISEPDTRWLVSAPTTGDLRGTCFEGESGLMSIIPPELVVSYNKTLFELVVRCHGGGTSLIRGISAEKPERFRGPQFHGGWLDELAAWTYLQASWDMIMFTMRLGQHPKIIVSTTPKPRPLIIQLEKNSLTFPTVTTRGASLDNFQNLAPTYQQQLMQYEGTQLGRQEIYGEIIDPRENGIIQGSWFNLWPHSQPLPAFDEIIISLDTAFTEKSRSRQDTGETRKGDPDPTACQVWGIFHTKPTVAAPAKTNAILLDAWDDHLGFPALLNKVQSELKSRYGGEEQVPVFRPAFGPRNLVSAGRTPDTVLIEEKGSGISLIQALAEEDIHAVAYNPGKADKLARLHSVSHIAYNGRLWMPESKKNKGQPMAFASRVLDQVCTFAGEGSIPHDDHVDAFSQCIKYVTDKYRVTVTYTKKDPEYDPQAERVRVNPYK
jgi:phage terminase large subunit-like protein